MIIEGANYKLTSIDDNSPFWDLELLKTIKSKTNPRTELVNVGYGLTIESAIRRIIHYNICSKHETLTLKEYLDEFKKLRSEILIGKDTSSM